VSVPDHLLQSVQHLLFNVPRTSVCGAMYGNLQAKCQNVQMPVASTWTCPSLLHAQAFSSIRLRYSSKSGQQAVHQNLLRSHTAIGNGHAWPRCGTQSGLSCIC
jgi:hypothetical protein